MITTKTVFILGAGASKPFGYPLGFELCNKIVETSYGDDFISSYPIARGQSIKMPQFKNFIERLKYELQYSNSDSIDFFLEQHKNNQDYMSVGKALIAEYLIRCEYPKRIFNSDENWYAYLLNTCMRTTFDNFKNNQVSFLTFNYDRSLEYCLHMHLKNMFSKSDNEVKELINSFPIIHLYGDIGLLPWQSETGFEYSISNDNLRERLQYAIDNIKILYEERQEAFSKARDIIVKSDQICFLGFGFLKENLERLDIQIMNDKTVIGSAYGLEISERSAINNYFNSHRVKIIWGDIEVKTLLFLKKYFTRAL